MKKPNEKKLLILGAGKQAKRAIEALAYDEYTKIAFLDNLITSSPDVSQPIVGKCDDLENFKQDYTHAFVCMNTAALRKRYYQRLIAANYEIPNIIHPRAYISPSAQLGVGIFINALAAVQTDSKIGDGCIINTGAVVSHDIKLGRYIFMGANSAVAGLVSVGDCSFIGIGACVKNNVNIGEDVLIAAGAVVISDIPNNVIAAGCPAKIIKQIDAVTKEML